MIVIFSVIIISLFVGCLILPRLAINANRERFTILDRQMLKIFQNIKTSPVNFKDWEYDKSCEAKLAGDWPTGQYYCSATINLHKTSTSVEELNNLQTQFFPIIDDTQYLTPTSELITQSPKDFGVNFVVSSAEKRYQEPGSGANCSYLIKLSQSVNDNYLVSDAYGSDINNGVGIISISLKCTGLANDDWYLNEDNS